MYMARAKMGQHNTQPEANATKVQLHKRINSSSVRYIGRYAIKLGRDHFSPY
jgi:hypothetical protein